MKAITVSQPYASMIADGRKFIENRQWPIQFTGPLAIHAGTGTQYLTAEDLEAFPTSQVIAVCELVGCLALKDVKAAYENGTGIGRFTANAIAEIAENLDATGPYCWLLMKVRKLKNPVQIRGSRGLWDFNSQLIRE